jgi:GxxExxY protein
MSNKSILYKDLSYHLIGACFTVHNKLGCGLPERVYNMALEIELTKIGISCNSQAKHDVYYDDNEQLSHFYTDLIVDNKIVVELKSTDNLYPHHQSQLLTYLRITKMRVGYLVNFGLSSVQYKRLIL